jgi:hypothetical protein
MNLPVETKCGSCYGEGTIFSEVGSRACPDCGGTGKTPSRSVLIARRLRDIETALAGQKPPSEADVRWLVFEVRRAREALVRIMSRTQDADETDRIAIDVKYMANEALEFYEPSSDSRS